MRPAVLVIVLAASAAVAAPASEGWLDAVSEDIREGEYHLSPKDGAEGWTAPNREQDRRAWWHDGALEVTPRVDAEAWTFTYRLASVGRSRETRVADVMFERVDEDRIEWQRGDLVEWYRNDARGIEQGFTLEMRPEGDESEPIVIEGWISGLLAYPSDDGSSVLLRTATGHDAMRIRDLVVRDADGAELESCLSVATGVLQIWFDDRDATYPVTVDPLLTSPSWTADGNQFNAYFGISAATAGDVNGDGYSDVIVGADGYDNGQLDEGRAFAYHGSASGLSTTPAWTAESNQAAGNHGWSVATAGDVNEDGFSDVIVGVPRYDNGESGEGRAFVYHGSALGLAAVAAWTAESDQASAAFGYSVATAGDVNGDGYADVVVGAEHFANGQSQEGRAFVFHGSAAGLSAVAAWTTESDQVGAALGKSVSTAGDLNGDGFADVIIGAGAYDNGQSNEGRAFVYHGSASGLAITAAWTAESNQAEAGFGYWVSTAGDLNGDGYADAIVGALLYDNGHVDEGRAFVYHGSASGLSAIAAWTAESDQADAIFGIPVATVGDVNGDGYADVGVGAPLYDNGEAEEGRAFVYQGSASGLATTPSWTAESDQAGANMGAAIATAGDVNGDGYSDVIVSAHEYDAEGRAFVYNGSAAGLAVTAGWTAEGDQADAGFGTSVATAGDVNGDGWSDVIVGAPQYDAGQVDEGRATVYHGSASGLALTATWTAESNQAGAAFGWSVASAGDVNGDGYSDVIVGAPQHDNGEAGEGRASVYQGSVSGLSTVAAWTAESDQASALFGISVATAGDVDGDGHSDVVVGASAYDGGQVDEGRAFAYLGSPSGLSPVAAWTAESDQASAIFGLSVATAGDVNADGYSDVIVGAYLYDDGEASEGRASAYLGSGSGLAATPAWTAEGNQVGAQLGYSVATAGDVNGDGYSDVIVGAVAYDNGESDEGRAFVYPGSVSGLSPSAAWTAEGDQAGAGFGQSVATAGDVNGDGHADVIVGAWRHDNGEPNEGRALAYLGSASGLSPTASWTFEANQVDAHLGARVATAGDVNGDGYSDVVVGADAYDGGHADEGRAFLFYGNAGEGLDRIARQRRADDSAPIDILGAADAADGFRISANGRSPYGRDDVRLEIEIEPLGTPFDGLGIETTPYTDTGAPGVSGSVVPLSLVLAPLAPGPHHWRARLRGTFPYPWQSHWMSPPYNGQTETDLRSGTFCDPPCDDGDACNGLETCDPTTGACVAGTPVVCNDGDACNGVETCDPGTGACAPGTPVICDDGDACNGVETCDPATGACVPGTPLACDDGDACNGVESCDAATGCVAGTPVVCGDGDACNGVETCDPATGACVGGTPVVCDDGDACNGVESCNAATGCVAGTPVVCDDGDACNGVETCDPATGACVGGTRPWSVTTVTRATAWRAAIPRRVRASPERPWLATTGMRATAWRAAILRRVRASRGRPSSATTAIPATASRRAIPRRVRASPGRRSHATMAMRATASRPAIPRRVRASRGRPWSATMAMRATASRRAIPRRAAAWRDRARTRTETAVTIAMIARRSTAAPSRSRPRRACASRAAAARC